MKINRLFKAILLLFFTFIFSLSSLVCYATSPVGLQRIVDNSVINFMQKSQVPGVAIAIYFQGKEYYFNYGIADKKSRKKVTSETIFELASITKVFTTSLLAIGVEQNKIHLQDSIVPYLPFNLLPADKPINKVKIINLATHTASLPRSIPDLGISRSDKPALLAKLSEWKPDYPIHSRYVYSNMGMDLLGMTLEKAFHQNYFYLLKYYILTPLNMTHTFIVVPKDKLDLQAQGYNRKGFSAAFYQPTYYYGGGALRSSSKDLMKFMKANLKVPSSAPTQLLAALQLTHKSYFKVRDGFAMGLGWQRQYRFNTLLLTKNGGSRGFSTFIGFSPPLQLGIVVLTNKAKVQASFLGNQLLQKLIILQSERK